MVVVVVAVVVAVVVGVVVGVALIWDSTLTHFVLPLPQRHPGVGGDEIDRGAAKQSVSTTHNQRNKNEH